MVEHSAVEQDTAGRETVRLDDPAINLAVSEFDQKTGLTHLGFDVETDEELAAITARLNHAKEELFEQDQTECCYARSNKTWVQDPQGVAWEVFHSLAQAEGNGTHTVEIPLSPQAKTDKSACC